MTQAPKATQGSGLFVELAKGFVQGVVILVGLVALFVAGIVAYIMW